MSVQDYNWNIDTIKEHNNYIRQRSFEQEYATIRKISPRLNSFTIKKFYKSSIINRNLKLLLT